MHCLKARRREGWEQQVQHSISIVERNIRVGSSSQLHLTGMSGLVSTYRHVRGAREATEGRGSCWSCHSISWLNGEETEMAGVITGESC